MLVISKYGHVYRIAEAIVEGVKKAPDEILEKHGALATQAALAKIPGAEIDRLSEAHPMIFVTSIRYRNMAAQMRPGHASSPQE